MHGPRKGRPPHSCAAATKKDGTRSAGRLECCDCASRQEAGGVQRRRDRRAYAGRSGSLRDDDDALRHARSRRVECVHSKPAKNPNKTIPDQALSVHGFVLRRSKPSSRFVQLRASAAEKVLGLPVSTPVPRKVPMKLRRSNSSRTFLRPSSSPARAQDRGVLHEHQAGVGIAPDAQGGAPAGLTQKENARTEVRAFSVKLGRPCGIRTCDQRIKSPLLYQLS